MLNQDGSVCDSFEPAGMSLYSALRAATRSARIGGVEIVRPDPIAAELLECASLAALHEALTLHGVRDLKPLAGGVSSYVLGAGPDKVVRLGFGELVDVPRVDGLLRAISSGTIGALRYEIMPRAVTIGVTEEHVENLYRDLRTKGIEWGDRGTDNMGFVEGRPVVIDPGGLATISHDGVVTPLPSKRGSYPSIENEA